MSTVYSVDVRVSAPIRDTEREDRVVRAVEQLFPEADLNVRADRVVGETHALDAFAGRLREQRILDTARTVFRQRSDPEGFHFDLKKQAALHGVVNFSVGNPDELGDVHVDVTVRQPDVDAFVDLLAPATDEEGKPLDDQWPGA